MENFDGPKMPKPQRQGRSRRSQLILNGVGLVVGVIVGLVIGLVAGDIIAKAIAAIW